MKRISFAIVGLLTCIAGPLSSAQFSPAFATPALVIDAASGEVLYQEEATRPWYPASTTKLMTVYVALKAVRDGRMSLDTPMLVSNRAARMQPSKMGFKPGTEITLDNALKIIMVKSANDVSVTIAEGVSGSVPAFAAEMNSVARQLGMRESHFVNPNGLYNDDHYSSARDMAILGRALYRDFPQHRDLYSIGALQLGRTIMTNHNGMLGRYPGADGMKTGFVCASGFNVVASATRGGRRLIAVVMGSPNAKARTLKVMSMIDAAFMGQTNSGGNVVSLADASDPNPPNMRPEICGRNRNRGIEEDFGIPVAGDPASQNYQNDNPAAFFAADRARAMAPVTAYAAAGMDLGPRPVFQPIPIFIGRAPGWSGAVAHADNDEAVDPAADAPRGKKGRRGRAVATAPAADVETPATPVKLGAKPAKPTANKTAARSDSKPLDLSGHVQSSTDKKTVKKTDKPNSKATNAKPTTKPTDKKAVDKKPVDRKKQQSASSRPAADKAD